MPNLIIIPTYNEKENIASLVSDIFKIEPDVSVLVVDDNSPDGTSQEVEKLKSEFPRLALLKRSGIRGFGRSYKDGFKSIADDERYNAIIMMDADFSHDPKEVPEMVRKLSEYDAVIGSRYVKGGRIKNWNWRRRLLSRFANFYAGVILGTPINDLTTGFMCFRRDILKKIDLDSIRSEGYAFLIDLKFNIFKAGYRIYEHSIVFNERREGQSKMSLKNIREAVWLPWKLKLSKK
jgi:dolichol-phosphate mannosyltransferase